MSDTELTNKEVKTRKDRKCDWCGEDIKKYQQVRYRTGLFGGDFYSVYEHNECYLALLNTDRDYLGYGYTPHEQLRGITMQDQ